MPTEKVLRLIYRSRCVIESEDKFERSKQLLDILRTARKRNEKLGVTGMLFFDGAHFGQVLEGPADSVLEVMTAIAGDRRHTDIDITGEEIDAPRIFGDWSMALVQSEGERIITLQPPEEPNKNQAPWLVSPEQQEVLNEVQRLVRGSP